MLLNAICTLDVVLCSPKTTALAAARLMRERHVGDLVVVDDPEGDRVPLGVITDRDIVVEVLGKELDPATTTVGSILRTPVVVVQDTEDVSQALERMRAHGVRRLPVVGSGQKTVGIVTLDDLLKFVAAGASALAGIVTQEQTRERRTRR